MSTDELREAIRRQKRKATYAERVLWKRLRSRGLEGFKIRRQHPINRFIVDFVCIEKRLVIEVDGKVHLGREEADEERTRILNGAGFSVIRFFNEDVINHLDETCRRILAELRSLPTPSEPQGTAKYGWSTPPLPCRERGLGGEAG